MVCNHLRKKLGKSLHNDLLIDCPIFLIYEMGKGEMKQLRYIVVMDPEVDFKDNHDEDKSGIIIHAVCDVTNSNASVNWAKKKEILLHFIHQSVIKFKADTLFLSGPFDNSGWLTDLHWLEYDESGKEENYWKERVGEDTRMFYADEIVPYTVIVKDHPIVTYNSWVARIEISPPKQIKKEEGAIFLLDKICGWVRMTDYLKKIYGYLIEKHLNIAEGERKFVTGFGSVGLVDDENAPSDMPAIAEEYRNDKGNHCVWLSACLLVKITNETLSNAMIKGLTSNLNLFDGLSITGKVNTKTLTEVLKDFNGVFCSKYKSKHIRVRVLDNGERLLPKCLLGWKSDLLLVCSLISEAGETGHCVGIDGKNKLIWDPSRRFAMSLNLGNLDDCCTFGGVRSKFVNFGMMGQIRVKHTDKK